MLRKSPTRTEAFLAANRRNALKSTGPRTARGKARSCMNNLKHGRYAKRLPETLTAAGDHGGAALYQKVREEIGMAFQAQPDDPRQMRQLDQMTAKVWLLARSAGINGRKPRSSIFSKKLGPRHRSRLLFRMQDRRRGITIVYWVQRKGYWNMARVMEAVAGRYPADAPTLGEILESKLRHRVFWPGSQPGRWGRLLSVVNECRRLVREDIVQPDPGVRPGQAGHSGTNDGSADRSQTAAPDGFQSGRGNASQRQAAGSGDTGSGAGGSGHSAQTASGSQSFLATVLAKLLGRE
ncbi:MAG: hypothetical protein ACLQOO_09440 [Terriglobia bacterium]